MKNSLSWQNYIGNKILRQNIYCPLYFEALQPLHDAMHDLLRFFVLPFVFSCTFVCTSKYTLASSLCLSQEFSFGRFKGYTQKLFGREECLS
jgi:hypothetical protein